MKYGKYVDRWGYRKTKIHRTGQHRWGKRASKCGMAYCNEFYDDISIFTREELCKRCFKEKIENHISFLLEEELFTI